MSIQPGQPGIDTDPRVSPDGRLLALQTGGDVWVHDIGRATLSRLTFEESTDETSAWSPDGRWIAWARNIGAERRVLRKRADGAGAEETLWTTNRHVHVAGWTPDDRALVVFVEQPSTKWDILLLPLGEKAAPRPLLASPFNELTPALSPDGRWIAYVSDESGRDEVYVRPFPSLDGKWQVSTSGGNEPVWARNARELFFGMSGGGFGHVDYDVSPDGRFVMVVRPAQPSTARRLVVVQNWLEELRQRVPRP